MKVINNRVLNYLYISLNIVRVIEWRKMKPSHMWEDNIKIDLLEMEFGNMDWIGLIQDRDRWQTLLNAVMKIRVP